MMKLYGIANCDTVKKARTWLENQHIEFEFHDFKKHGLSAELAQHWLQQRSWEQLINRKGMTWRGLTDQQKLINDITEAQNLMLEKTSVIKRPLLEQNGKLLHLGFDDATYRKLFNL